LAEVALLRMCWSATDGICSKRLAPFLPDLLLRLRHISAQTIECVAHMSPATIDRALAASSGAWRWDQARTVRPRRL